MKKILVPTDFSDYAENAIQTAYHIAQKANYTLTILHVIPNMRSYTNLFSSQSNIEVEYLDYVKDSAEHKLKKNIDNYDFEKINIEILVKTGNIVKTIFQESESEDVALIVMGSKGTSGLEEIFVGSNTEKIVRSADCPVLTVGKKPTILALAKIVFATNFRNTYQNVIDRLRMYQTLFEAKIYLLYINTPAKFLSTEEILEKKNKFVKESKLDNYEFQTYEAFTEEEGLIRFSESIDTDLIALITQQKRGLKHFFEGSLTENVLNHTEIPVLSMGINMR